jgi:predicted nucleic acid-binding protein
VAIVLLDTDILINFLRGVEKAKLYVQNEASDGIPACSAIAVAEIYAGMRAHEKEKTDALLDSLEIIEVTRAIAEKAGTYKASTGSRVLELDDCIIATTRLRPRRSWPRETASTTPWTTYAHMWSALQRSESEKAEGRKGSVGP